MPQLDETIVNLQAGHISDHQQLAEKANYVLDVKDFGVTGDGSTDDTVAIQAAIDAAPAGGSTIFFPPGNYHISSELTMTASGVELLGASMAGVLINNQSATANFINVTASKCAVRNLTILAGINRTGGIGIIADGDRCKIENVKFNSPYIGIDVTSNADRSYIQNVDIVQDPTFTGTYIGIRIRGNGSGASCANVGINNVVIQSGSTGFAGGMIVISDEVDSLVMDNVTAVDTTSTPGSTAVTIDSPTGGAAAPRWIKFINCFFESGGSTGTGANGIEIIDCNGVELINCYAMGCDVGIMITGGSGIGIKDSIIAQNMDHGIAITGGVGILISGNQISGNSRTSTNTKDGINVGANASEFVITGNYVGKHILSPSVNHRYGILVTGGGTADDFIIAHNRVVDSTTADITDNSSGSNKVVANNVVGA